jgi:hypothetical protein
MGALALLLDEEAADAYGTDREHDDEVNQAVDSLSVVYAVRLYRRLGFPRMGAA